MKKANSKRLIAVAAAFMLALTIYAPTNAWAKVIDENVVAGNVTDENVTDEKSAVSRGASSGDCDSDVWDGSVDISWYDPEETEFTITKPAQLAGLAALVNGMASTDVTGFRGNDKIGVSTPAELREKCAIREEKTTTGTGSGNKKSIVYYGKKEYDFMGKTVKLGANLNMGGVHDSSKSFNETTWKDDSWSGPNWTPIGGGYPMDTTDYTNKANDQNLPYRWFQDRQGNDIDIYVCDAAFNGVFDGQGHTISNIYCDRYTAKDFMWSQNIALFGNVGYLYGKDERGKQAEVLQEGWVPAIRNLKLGSEDISNNGAIYGRRCIGGIAGNIGSNEKDEEVPALIENCANYVNVSGTDYRGRGGLCAEAQQGTSIRNCYNAGAIRTGYDTAMSGGICGWNEGANIYNCYNIGEIQANYGRAIGGHQSGKYEVDNCYYLEGCDNKSPEANRAGGYFLGTTQTTNKVVVKQQTEEQMKDEAFVSNLNGSGAAFVYNEGGFPQLFYEATNSIPEGNFSVTLNDNSQTNGTLAATKTGNIKYGECITLSATPASEYILESYAHTNPNSEGNKLVGDYYTVTADAVKLYANFIKLEKGQLVLVSTDEFVLSAKKNGLSKQDDGTFAEVSKEEAESGKGVYETNQITVTARLKKGITPKDKNLEYTGVFEYTFDYDDGSNPIKNQSGKCTVGKQIGTSSKLQVTAEPLTQEKTWLGDVDTSWYDDSKATFNISTPQQLAGLAYLVNREGQTFEGKTVNLTSGVSLKNADGTTGTRYWKAIGVSSTKTFKGTFNGQGHTIKDMTAKSSNYAALFGYCKGGTIKNIIVKGTANAESNAAGILAQGDGAKIENCKSYVDVNITGSEAAGIAAATKNGTSISKCVNKGAVTGPTYVGGIAGKSEAKNDVITSTVNYGTVTGNSTTGYAGGIVASLTGSVYYSGNEADIICKGKYNGGIAGYTKGSGEQQTSTVTGSYNSGKIITETTDAEAETRMTGGLIGYAQYLKLSNCYNTGEISGEKYTAAIVGKFYRSVYSSIAGAYYLSTSAAYAINDNGGNLGAVKGSDGKVVSYVKTYAKADSAMKTSAFATTMNSGITKTFLPVSGTYPKLIWANGDKIFTVTYTGEYEGSVAVYTGEDIALPVSPNKGKEYVFTADGKQWDGTNITSNVTVTVAEQDKTYYAAYKANGVILKKVPFKYGDDITAVTDNAPDIPPKGGCDAAWETIESGDEENKMDAGDIEVNAIYTQKESGRVRGGSKITADGYYYPVGNASGTITVAAGINAVIDGENGPFENLRIVTEAGEGNGESDEQIMPTEITLKDITLANENIALSCQGNTIINAEGENKVNAEASTRITEKNANPAISITADTCLRGTGKITAESFKASSPLIIENGATFTQEAATFNIDLHDQTGTFCGAAFVPKGTLHIDGGEFNAVSTTDNVEGLLAQNLIIDGGNVCIQSLDTKSMLALYVENLTINGGSLKAVSKNHVDEGVKERYVYDADAIFKAEPSEDLRETDKDKNKRIALADEVDASGNELLTAYSEPLGYYLCKVKNLTPNMIIKVDGEEFYNGDGYSTSYDTKTETFANAKDRTAYLWLEDGSHTVEYYGIIHNVSNKSQKSVTLDADEIYIAKQKIYLSQTSFEYNGKAKKPKVSVNGLTENANFTVTYKNNIAPGTASVTVKGILPYEGEQTVTYKILPARVSIGKLTTKKKQVTVKWKKTKCSGYQIQVATKSNFKKGLKTVKVSAKAASTTVKKLNSKKKYYARVRAYVTTTQGTYYGAWSKVKSIKCK